MRQLQATAWEVPPWLFSVASVAESSQRRRMWALTFPVRLTAGWTKTTLATPPALPITWAAMLVTSQVWALICLVPRRSNPRSSRGRKRQRNQG